MTEKTEILNCTELPGIIPVFPLPGALIFPGVSLPLNVFEPRYLAMVGDVLTDGRWIGVVQPLNALHHPIPNDVEIFGVGSLARLDTFENIDEERMLVNLIGITRFSIECELEGRNGYRLVKANYQSFEEDLTIDNGKLLDRKRLITAAESFFQHTTEEIDLSNATDITDTMLLNALCMASPLTVAEKQALLECKRIVERGELLSNLLEMASLSDEIALSSTKH